MKSEFEQLKEFINGLYNEVDSLDYDDELAENKFYEAQKMLEEFQNNNWEEFDLSELRKKLEYVKKELNLYDEQSELDRMFRNRHDDDFDGDDMSGESFFKD